MCGSLTSQSVAELIVNGQAGYDKRFYYPQPDAPNILVKTQAAGAGPEVWTVQAISNNRLTTSGRRA
jgi:hypothetical protein